MFGQIILTIPEQLFVIWLSESDMFIAFYPIIKIGKIRQVDS